MEEQEELYKAIDGNMSKLPVGYCHYYKHRGYMSKKLLELHGCNSRKCKRLEKLECKYWEDRKKRKENAKKARKEFKERKL